MREVGLAVICAHVGDQGLQVGAVDVLSLLFGSGLFLWGFLDDNFGFHLTIALEAGHAG